MRGGSGVSMPEHFDLNLLSAFAEQKLSGGEREIVLRHLSNCRVCRDCLAMMDSLVQTSRKGREAHPTIWIGGVAAAICILFLATRFYAPAVRTRRDGSTTSILQRTQELRNRVPLAHISLSAFDNRTSLPPGSDLSLSPPASLRSVALVNASFVPVSSATEPNRITLKTALGDRWISVDTIPARFER